MTFVLFSLGQLIFSPISVTLGTENVIYLALEVETFVNVGKKITTLRTFSRKPCKLHFTAAKVSFSLFSFSFIRVVSQSGTTIFE